MNENTMLAVVYYGPNDLRIEQRPIPEIGPGEALLAVESASICGTDLRILHVVIGSTQLVQYAFLVTRLWGEL